MQTKKVFRLGHSRKKVFIATQDLLKYISHLFILKHRFWLYLLQRLLYQIFDLIGGQSYCTTVNILVISFCLRSARMFIYLMTLYRVIMSDLKGIKIFIFIPPQHVHSKQIMCRRILLLQNYFMLSRDAKNVLDQLVSVVSIRSFQFTSHILL